MLSESGGLEEGGAVVRAAHGAKLGGREARVLLEIAPEERLVREAQLFGDLLDPRRGVREAARRLGDHRARDPLVRRAARAGAGDGGGGGGDLERGAALLLALAPPFWFCFYHYSSGFSFVS